MENTKKSFLDHWILWPTIVVLAIFCVYVATNKEGADAALATAGGFITNKLPWVYQVSAFFYFLIILGLVFSKYGSKKLGDIKPEFSTFTWLGLIFTSSSSASVLVWSSLEAYYYVKFPPFEIEAFSITAYEWAQAYSFFHWGPIAFALYCVLGVVFGYAMHVKKLDITRPSGIFSLIHGEKFANSWKGKLIDILSLFSLVCGYSTSLGICTPLISKLLEQIFGLQASFGLNAIIVLAITSLITLCVYAGLYKGIKVLSDVRVYIGYGLLIILFLVGPTSFIINNFFSSFGIMLQNIVRMTFYSAPFGDNSFPQDWTIFYFAWFTSISTVCGIYLGRISAGRTVRQVLLGSLGAYVLGNWIYFIVLQNYSIFLQRQGQLDFDAILATGGTAGVTVATWSLLPHATLFLVAFLVIAYIATTTFLNGAVYTCATITSKDLSSTEQPGRFIRVFWGLFISAIALSLIYIEGLKPVQRISIIGSLPMTFIALGMIYTFLKCIKKDKW